MGIHMMPPLYEKIIKPGWGPPQTHEYLCLPYDGILRTEKGYPYQTYAENWASTWGYLLTVGGSITLTNHDYDNYIEIYRGALFFDTSTLPSNCLIVSAKVRLLCSIFGLPRSQDLCLTPATLVHTPLVQQDYGNLNQTLNIIGSYPTDDIVVLDQFWIDLIEDGLEHITKAGNTHLGMRLSLEIAADPNLTEAERIYIGACENIYGRRLPLLSVTYKLPA